MFEVQLTSLINGWGLTYDGLCCSSRRHLSNYLDYADNTVASIDYDDDAPGQGDYSGNEPRDRDDEEEWEEDEEEEEEEEEGDWGCEGECRTFLRVCLSHLQDPLPAGETLTLTYLCTFGEALSPVVGGNMLDPFGTWQESAVLDGSRVDPATVVSVPFTFSWPVS